MRSHIRAGFVMAAAAASLMSSAAFAQTPTTATPMTNSATSTSWMTQEVAGQWRTSKIIGLNVYNNENEKIGGISELIVDRAGKLEAVVVGVGGFLGLGEHDVAVPYAQISWVGQPVPSPRTSTSTAPVTTGVTSTTDRAAEGPRSYPDHAVLNMTKDQLKAAPEFKFSR